MTSAACSPAKMPPCPFPSPGCYETQCVLEARPDRRQGEKGDQDVGCEVAFVVAGLGGATEDGSPEAAASRGLFICRPATDCLHRAPFSNFTKRTPIRARSPAVFAIDAIPCFIS